VKSAIFWNMTEFSPVEVFLYFVATSRNIMDSIHDEAIGLFNLPNPFSRTIALVSTQPLTEMSTRNLPGGKGRPARKADKHRYL
jgi:hypothetical protein